MFSIIKGLVNYAINEKLITDDDRVYITNSLLKELNISDYKDEEAVALPLATLLDKINDYAVDNGFINNTLTERDLFDTRIMGILLDRPSNIINSFEEKYRKSPREATDYFYHLATKANYIRLDRIQKDIKWKTKTRYGILDITINLSKPEKDPQEIAMAKLHPTTHYPKCLLCRENEGYMGRFNHPARENLRLIPLTLGKEAFYMQYSPYVYYNEHIIVLNQEHKPMIIDEKVFEKLLDFVDLFPHYFIGSNADLPIVGGSILTHEHFQGGNYEFAMDKAETLYSFSLDGCKAEVLKWPLSTIRLKATDKNLILNTANYIFNKWLSYNDFDNMIYASTDGVRHNTITPIVRKKDDEYIINLVLRNNLTTNQFPFGLYHPHSEYHHLKKENIGLIEVMGLAILPRRLKGELEEIKEAILTNTEFNAKIKKHEEWINSLKKQYTFTKDNINEILQQEIGYRFSLILDDAGVFKQTPTGIKAFRKFTNTL